MKNKIKINLKFEFYEDDPNAKNIKEAFKVLLETLAKKENQ